MAIAFLRQYFAKIDVTFGDDKKDGTRCTVLYFLEIKVAFCVFVANAADNFFKSLEVRRIFAILYPAADKVTEYAAEIFVTRVGNETATVGKHTNEASKHSEV